MGSAANIVNGLKLVFRVAEVAVEIHTRQKFVRSINCNIHFYNKKV